MKSIGGDGEKNNDEGSINTVNFSLSPNLKSQKFGSQDLTVPIGCDACYIHLNGIQFILCLTLVIVLSSSLLLFFPLSRIRISHGTSHSSFCFCFLHF